jgi:hypothetical protein
MSPSFSLIPLPPSRTSVISFTVTIELFSLFLITVGVLTFHCGLFNPAQLKRE